LARFPGGNPPFKLGLARSAPLCAGQSQALDSHEILLYSSAFVVDKTVGGFVLSGAGWGHGVGLCQIGAAVMANEGKPYTEILHHYYRGTTISV
jgi:SpoIID/LytB domain protein